MVELTKIINEFLSNKDKTITGAKTNETPVPINDPAVNPITTIASSHSQHEEKWSSALVVKTVEKNTESLTSTQIQEGSVQDPQLQPPLRKWAQRKIELGSFKRKLQAED